MTFILIRILKKSLLTKSNFFLHTKTTIVGNLISLNNPRDITYLVVPYYLAKELQK